MNPVILGIATLYVTQIEKREIMENQVYSPVFKKAMQIVDKYFSHLVNGRYRDFDDEQVEAEYYRRYWQNIRDTFDFAFREYVGNSAIFPFVSPTDDRSRYDFAIMGKNEFDISLPYAYMNNDDWMRIVEKGEFDTMNRAESKAEFFIDWKENLSKFHPRTNLDKV